MIRLVYGSVSRLGTASSVRLPHLVAIMEASRAINFELAVTGMLIFDDRRFAQVFEGPAGEVEMIYRRIVEDSRHESVELVARAECDRRFFRDWSMAYDGTCDGVAEKFNMLEYRRESQVNRSEAGIVRLLQSVLH